MPLMSFGYNEIELGECVDNRWHIHCHLREHGIASIKRIHISTQSTGRRRIRGRQVSMVKDLDHYICVMSSESIGKQVKGSSKSMV
ncbi:MAG: hypothetical protein CM15mV74_250 [uncultured marine virus]|nr:MAG: hypothetical protein CM15mV74_250 [uncultured marine virus]